MGRLMGIEPMHAGATIQCVNRFTKAAMKTSNALSSQSVSRQVLSAYECLTTVFGMGTGGTTQLSSLDIHLSTYATLKTIQKKFHVEHFSFRKISPRFISTGPLHALRHFHSQPIYLVFFKESYWITP